jgi:putative GTP pyrophosphokinase
MAYPTPPISKSAVRRAGASIADGTSNLQEIAIVDQWRASHGYVINTFQAWIRGHISRRGEFVEFAQRLKRRNTVIDKLQRKRTDGTPLIADVTGMHDFAGCRMIFEDLEDLQRFRSYMHSSTVMKNVEHELRHVSEKYDYIEHPKSSGYRGIHDVYKHFPRGSKRREDKKPWDGLLVALQYRTRAQHAWATAVEISDLLDGEKTKFEMDQTERGRFFALASEIIARRHEGITKGFSGETTVNLGKQLQRIERKLGILRRLELLRQFEVEDKLQEHNVLSIMRSDDGSFELDVIPFKTAAPAIQKATELEESGKSINAVYVRSENPKQLRSAYRNYFYDPVDFVEMIRDEVG